MSDLDEIRQSFPQLSHIPDYDLAEMIHEKHFSEVPKDEYYRNIGLNVPSAKTFQPEDYQDPLEATITGGGRAIANLPENVGSALYGLGSAAMHPVESGKALVAEGLRGANTLAQNLPNNIVEYIRERQNKKIEDLKGKNYSPLANSLREMIGLPTANTEKPIPDWVSGDWASPETKQSMNETVERYAPSYDKSIAGAQLAGTIGKYAPAAAIGSLLGPGGSMAGIAAQDIAENQNPIEGVLTAKLLKESPKAIKPIAKGVGEVAKKVPGVETAAKAVTQPFKDISRAKQLEKSLIEMEKQKIKGTSDLEAKRESIAGKTAAKIAADTQAIETEATNLKKFAPTEEAASRKNLQQILHDKSKELRTEANENFNNVYAEPVGNKTLGTSRLETPLVKSNIEAGFYGDALKYLTDSAKAGHEIPASLRGTSKNAPTVKEAVDFAKLVQKEKLRAYEKGKNTNLPEAESRNYESMYKKLSELEKDVWSDVEQNITPGQYSNIKEAFKKWGEIVTPFETHSFLMDATDKFGKINQANAFEAINKLGADELVKRLSQDSKVSEAVAKHDLMGFDATNVKNIRSLLDSDQGRALPVETQNILKRQLKNLENLDSHTKAGQAISESQIRSILKEPKMKKILQNDPQLLQDLADSKTMQKALKRLEQDMKEAGIEQKEISMKMGIINKAASIAGLGFVLKVLH